MPATVKIPSTHKACFHGTTPSRQIVKETIDFSVGQRGGVVGWPGPIPITRVRPNRAPKEAAPVPSAGVKMSKTAHDAVDDAADDVADDAAVKASGKKGQRA